MNKIKNDSLFSSLLNVRLIFWQMAMILAYVSYKTVPESAIEDDRK